MADMILILDFGGTQGLSVAKKIRGERVYCEVLPCDAPIETIRSRSPKGILLAGGESEGGADCDPRVYGLGVPILAIGRGSRAMLRRMGGKSNGPVYESGTATIDFSDTPLFAPLASSERFIDRMDDVTLPEGFARIAEGLGVAAAFADEARGLYGMQFGAEQNDPDGLTVLSNFAKGLCGCDPWWSTEAFIERETARIREQVGDGSALIAISGGVDSSVCAALMHRAIGNRVHCLHVDTGLMRKGESENVARLFRERMGIDLIRIDAGDRFLKRLAGVIEPEKKRDVIGEEFVRIFEEEARKLPNVRHLVQGTIYPDVVESLGIGGKVLKSHHNVGGFPTEIEFESVVEPLRELFKDEVREVGEALKMPREFIQRQPFPGPGLAVRCVGEVNEEKLKTLREADAIFTEEIDAAGLDRKIWQYFAILTDLRTTGVVKGERAYDRLIALRAVNTVDAVTATAARLPYDLIERVVGRIAQEVPGASRVVYDVTGKPPATIEWE